RVKDFFNSKFNNPITNTADESAKVGSNIYDDAMKTTSKDFVGANSSVANNVEKTLPPLDQVNQPENYSKNYRAVNGTVDDSAKAASNVYDDAMKTISNNSEKTLTPLDQVSQPANYSKNYKPVVDTVDDVVKPVVEAVDDVVKTSKNPFNRVKDFFNSKFNNPITNTVDESAKVGSNIYDDAMKTTSKDFVGANSFFANNTEKTLPTLDQVSQPSNYGKNYRAVNGTVDDSAKAASNVYDDAMKTISNNSEKTLTPLDQVRQPENYSKNYKPVVDNVDDVAKTSKNPFNRVKDFFNSNFGKTAEGVAKSEADLAYKAVKENRKKMSPVKNEAFFGGNLENNFQSGEMNGGLTVETGFGNNTPDFVSVKGIEAGANFDETIKAGNATLDFKMNYSNNLDVGDPIAKTVAQGNYDNIVQTGVGFSKDDSGIFKILDSDGTLTKNINEGLAEIKLSPGMSAATDESTLMVVTEAMKDRVDDMSSEETSALFKKVKRVRKMGKREARWYYSELLDGVMDEKVTLMNLSSQIKETKADILKTAETGIMYENGYGITQDAAHLKNLEDKIDIAKKNYTNGIKKGIIKQEIGERFLTRNGRNKMSRALGLVDDVFSSKAVRIMTGNYVPSSIALPVAAITGTLSTFATMHQTTSINNFRSFQTNEYSSTVDRNSEEAEVSANGHRELTASNEQDMYYMKANHNVAKKYLNNIDNISLDENSGKLSSFTVY
ncbi:MAG: hypothetical protein ACRC5T_11520, partial [Cetobacterium sp.]